MKMVSHRVEVVPMVVAPSGNLTNHHRLPNGDIGERVTEGEATHFGVHSFWVIEAKPPAAP